MAAVGTQTSCTAGHWRKGFVRGSAKHTFDATVCTSLWHKKLTCSFRNLALTAYRWTRLPHLRFAMSVRKQEPPAVAVAEVWKKLRVQRSGANDGATRDCSSLVKSRTCAV